MGFQSMWQGLAARSKVSFVAGAVAILLGMAALGWWALRAEPEVLFARLSAQDAAALTHELEQMKVPFTLAEDGTTILVDKAQVHQTRLKLMGKDLPLHGAVGFELFNSADFGMTEFAQRVNYQRALQGELTRTIMSLTEVETARVHIAFADEGLFKREQARAKASVTLRLHQGTVLRREQVQGVQRLVAAAVPGIESRDVTVLNDQGVALTSEPGATDGAVASSARLDLKREIELYLAHKANAVLDQAFGHGQAMASVDVTLDMDQVKITKEDVLTPPAQLGEGVAGVILRERETTRDDGRPSGPDAIAPVSTQHETEYQLGRRVEQVVGSPGAISRLQVLAVLKRPMTEAQTERLKKVLGSAVGLTHERGDVVVVQSVDGLMEVVAAPPSMALPKEEAPRTGAAVMPKLDVPLWLGGLLAAMLGVMAWKAMTWRRRREPSTDLPRLSVTERDAQMVRLRQWLAQEPGMSPQVLP